MGDVVLPCGPEAAGMARRIVAEACVTAGLPAEVCDSAQLCTSELVTNAIVHGRSEVRLHVSTTGGPAPEPPPGPVGGPGGGPSDGPGGGPAAAVVAGSVRIEVGDDNSRHPRIQPADEGALDGRGLFIVDLLASRWGVRDDDIGKLVWLEIIAAPPVEA